MAFRTKRHNMVPQHEILDEKEVKEIMEEYETKREKLPKIEEKDPAIEDKEVSKGDVIKVVRDSETAGKAVVYRVVV